MPGILALGKIGRTRQAVWFNGFRMNWSGAELALLTSRWEFWRAVRLGARCWRNPCRLFAARPPVLLNSPLIRHPTRPDYGPVEADASPPAYPLDLNVSVQVEPVWVAPRRKRRPNVNFR
jgi:hypothetical protein